MVSALGGERSRRDPPKLSIDEPDELVARLALPLVPGSQERGHVARCLSAHGFSRTGLSSELGEANELDTSTAGLETSLPRIALSDRFCPGVGAGDPTNA